MKRTVLNLFMMVFALSLLNFAPNQANKFGYDVAVISFESQIIDYGTIIQHSDGAKVFKFTNKGNEPLLITNVKSSCGCTVPSYSKEPILPGESGEIKIKYNTSKLGAFTKTITVSSNSEEGQTILKIKGTVVASE